MNSPQNKASAWARVAARQAGVLSKEQFLAEASPAALRTAVGRGQLQVVGTGVYRVAGSEPSWQQRVWVACLETGGLASHRTAGWLWGLDGLGRRPPEPLEVLISHQSRFTSDGVTVRRSRSLSPSHARQTPGIPMTNLGRTIIDLSEVLAPPRMEEAFDSALRQQADLRAWVRRLLKRVPTRGHRGIGVLTALLDASSDALDSALEVQLLRLIRQAGLPAPAIGVDVVHDGHHVAKLDFAWPHRHPPVALLAHGFRWHGNARRWQRDVTQVSELSALGWRVVQCTAEDVRLRPESIVRQLRQALLG